VSGHSAMVCGGSGHGVVVMSSGGVHMLRLWEMGKAELHSPLESMWNSSAKSSRMNAIMVTCCELFPRRWCMCRSPWEGGSGYRSSRR
jgi:hypothetical protein